MIAIILSISCTLRLLVSLIDKVNKNPIIIYRDDSPIDVTSVRTVRKITNILNISYFSKIPFPAFTICSPGEPDTTFEVKWLNKFTVSGTETISDSEHCRTVNMAPLHELFQPAAAIERFVFHLEAPFTSPRMGFMSLEKLYNKTKPYATTSATLGFDGLIYSGAWYHQHLRPGVEPYRIAFHSPYEMPSSKDHQFFVLELDYASFLIIPQLKKIDETMLGMKPSE